MRRNGYVISSLVLAALLMGSLPVFALSLDEAKAKGLVGEKTNGYLGVVASGDADAKALSDDVNQKRRQAYQDIARREKMDLRTVETLAGKKAMGKTPPGNFVEGPGGWVRK